MTNNMQQQKEQNYVYSIIDSENTIFIRRRRKRKDIFQDIKSSISFIFSNRIKLF
jgi:hypothetical protein